MSDDNVLRIEIDASGAAKASADLQRVAKSVDSTTEATKKNTAAVAAQAEKFKIGSVEIDKFGSTLGVAGQAVGRLNSTAGQMVTSLGAATGAIQSLTTAGLGPLGIAVTVANLAITAGVALFNSYGREAENAKGKIDDLRRSLSDLIGEQARQAADEELRNKLRAGRGTVTEQRGYLSSVQQEGSRSRLELEELNRNAPTVASGEYGAFLGQRRDLERRIAQASADEADARQRVADAERDASLVEENARRRRALQNDADVAAAEGLIGNAPEARRSRGGGRGGSMVAAREGLDENARKYIAGKAAGFADSEAMQAIADREAEAAAQAIQAQKNRDAAIYEERMQAEQKITDMLAEEEDRRKSLAEEADAARIESMQRTADAIQSIGSMMTQIYGFVDDAGSSADESEEQREKKRLKRLAFAQSVEAIVNAAQSVVAFARADPVGGAMYAVASGLNIAAAAKAGIDAGNVPTQGGSGGAAGSAMRNDSRSSSQSSREPLTVVVNMNGPTIATADRAELGRQINQLVSEGRGRYGEAA